MSHPVQARPSVYRELTLWRWNSGLQGAISDDDPRGEIIKVALAAQTVLDVIGRFYVW